MKQQPILKLLIVAAVLFAATTLSAQQPTDLQVARFYRHGDMLRLAVTFDGPNVGDITAVQISLLFNGTQPPEGQRGFDGQLNGGESKRISPISFEVSFKIPEKCLSGDYRPRIRAVANGRVIFYTSPKDFQEQIFKIDDPVHFDEPTINSITRL